MRSIIILLAMFIACQSYGQQEPNSRTRNFPREEIKPSKLPKKNRVWVFILAGQSNMAGRGLVEPQDTIPSDRILTINRNGEITVAKEPLHFYEPTMTGLDCGLSFGKEMLTMIPQDISILLIPTAVGGSTISQWLGDSIHRQVPLLTNFEDKVRSAKKAGKIKGILWHQGEGDANEIDIPLYEERLGELFTIFRKIAGNKKLPVVLGELGTFSKNSENWMKINEQIHLYVSVDNNSGFITTADLNHKGDGIHFDSEGQRIMGRRFARKFSDLLE